MSLSSYRSVYTAIQASRNRSLILGLLLLVAALCPTQSLAASGIALVQHTSKDAGTTTISSLAFASPTTAGNWIAVAIRGGLSSSQVFTVVDSNGNTYRQAAQIGFTSSAVTLAIYYAENIKGGANTITVSDTVSGPLRFAILEYSGVATSNSLDVTAVATGIGTSANSGSMTTTASGDLLLGTIATADAATYTAGIGFTIRDFVPAEPNTKLISEDQIQTTAGIASASASLAASGNWGAVLAAFTAAGGGGGTPSSITATAGTPQSAAINTAFATQLQATVKDSLNNPVSGVTVTFTAPASGASGTFAGGVNTATTNAQGVATAAVFTANSTAGGPYNVTASVAGAATPANFSLTNVAGAPASIAATAGTPQSATINTAFVTQLQATVKDAGNNPVSGATVTFTVPASGASGTFAGGVNTALTNVQGVATAAIFTANGTAGGPYTVTATVTGVATPANFSLTNLAGPPASITVTAGTPQSANVNTTFAAQLQATVKDAGNNPVNGVTVTFTAPASGASGTFAGGVNTATTNAQGVATAPIFTANSIAGGPYTVAASVSGVATPANFSLTNVAAAPSSIALVQHTSKDAGTTTTSSLAFVSPNAAGNWIAVSIRGGLSSSQVFTVSDSSSNTYRQAAQIGFTSSAVTLAIYYAENIKGGANTITVSDTVSGPLRFAILEYSGVATSNSLDLTAVATAVSSSPNSGNVTTTANGDLLLGAIATADAGAYTAGAGYTIRDFVPAEPNTKLISEDQIQTTAGIASASASLAASGSWGAVLAAFKAAGGTAGTPSSITATAGTPQSATVNTAFATPLQATVKDSLNNPVSGVTVTFTALTNAQGVATAAIFTANSTAGGPYSVTASVTGVASPANFSLTNLASPPASIATTAGTPQSAAINTAFATQLQATVKDAGNNPVSGATVTFTVPASGASGTFAGGVNTALTNVQGVATAAIFTANSTAGG